jgi:hypothetical protein
MKKLILIICTMCVFIYILGYGKSRLAGTYVCEDKGNVVSLEFRDGSHVMVNTRNDMVSRWSSTYKIDGEYVYISYGPAPLATYKISNSMTLIGDGGLFEADAICEKKY